MVWENVPGAFSSNKGEDFRIVLEETAKIADETAVIPRPDKGIWSTSGAIMGDGWSIAWRVFDAQFWGVPQRRRRIALVADFGGQSAPEILFERQSVSGNPAESGAEGQGTAGGATGCFRETGVGYWGEGVGALRAQPDGSIGGNVVVAGFCQGASPAAQTIGYQEEVSPIIKGAPSGTAQVPAVFDARGNGDGLIAPTMTGDHQNRVTDYTGIVAFQNTGHGWWNESDIGATVRTPCGGDSTKANLVAAVVCRNGTENPDINGTLQAKSTGGMSCNLQNTVRTNQSVRRLTPLECERLQGYEDGWTNIPPQTKVTADDLSFWRAVWDEWDDMNGKKRHTDKQIVKWLQSESADSARYKALGNSIALPPWRFVLSRIHKQGARTMASLFDGIGGFPKI
jgi:DNA (cytosine-5)-methyltransferase 1